MKQLSLYIIFITVLFMAFSCTAQRKDHEKEGWIALFNGKDEGDTVLQYSKPQIGGSIVHNYLASEKVDGKILKEGFIDLQSEGQPVEFRNIYLKDLSKVYKKKSNVFI